MPRETVRDAIDMWDVQVGWSNESVQIGVTSRDNRPITELLENPEQYTGLWSNLDRDGCNRMIRLIRRARDGAYGSDA